MDGIHVNSSYSSYPILTIPQPNAFALLVVCVWMNARYPTNAKNEIVTTNARGTGLTLLYGN